MLLTKELIKDMNLPVVQEENGGYRFLQSVCFLDNGRVLIGDEAKEFKCVIMFLIFNNLNELPPKEE
ncbi:MAG: hypothetical protein ABIG90_02990 [bacterium]